MSRLFLFFLKKTIEFFPISNEYFFMDIKFYYCISTLVHVSKSVKKRATALLKITFNLLLVDY